jgi:hypothetical protein
VSGLDGKTIPIRPPRTSYPSAYEPGPQPASINAHAGIADLAEWTGSQWAPTDGSSSRPSGELLRQQAHMQRARLWRPVRGARRVTLPDPTELLQGVVAHFSDDGKNAYTRALGDITVRDIYNAQPMRDFSRRHGQNHKPVATSLRTTQHLVPAESQHERAFLRLADYHPDIAHVAAQPFTLDWRHLQGLPAGNPKTHTPDFLLFAPGQPPLVVDVKIPSKASEPKEIARHQVIRDTLHAAGIFYVVWVGVHDHVSANLANFRAARVSPATRDRWQQEALTLCTQPIAVQDVIRGLSAAGMDPMRAPTLIRALLWDRHLFTDMTVRFSPRSVVSRPDPVLEVQGDGC